MMLSIHSVNFVEECSEVNLSNFAFVRLLETGSAEIRSSKFDIAC